MNNVASIESSAKLIFRGSSRQPSTAKGNGQSINPRNPIPGTKNPARISKKVITTQGNIRFIINLMSKVTRPYISHA